jgi:hypothetical protein
MHAVLLKFSSSFAGLVERAAIEPLKVLFHVFSLGHDAVELIDEIEGLLGVDILKKVPKLKCSIASVISP